jgi:hypothetical protein
MSIQQHNVRASVDKNGVQRKAHVSHHHAGENIDLAAAGGGANRKKPAGWTGLPQPVERKADEAEDRAEYELRRAAESAEYRRQFSADVEADAAAEKARPLALRLTDKAARLENLASESDVEVNVTDDGRLRLSKGTVEHFYGVDEYVDSDQVGWVNDAYIESLDPNDDEFWELGFSEPSPNWYPGEDIADDLEYRDEALAEILGDAPSEDDPTFGDYEAAREELVATLSSDYSSEFASYDGYRGMYASRIFPSAARADDGDLQYAWIDEWFRRRTSDGESMTAPTAREVWNKLYAAR